MNSSQQSQPKQPSNTAEEAIKALSLLEPDEQKLVLEYITALVDSQNEQGEN